MNEKRRLLSVWNTCTRSFEMVEVSEEVYAFYRRYEWREQKHDGRVRKHETLFSELKGGDGGAYENFREFIADNLNPESQYFKEDINRLLVKAVSKLEEADRLLLEALYRMEKTEKQYAEELGMTQQAISKRKGRILKALKKDLRSKGYTF